MDVTPATLAEEIERLTSEGHALLLRCHPMMAFSMVALLQLALRHPGVTGFTRSAGDEVVMVTRSWFEAIGAAGVVQAIDQGSDPANDVPPEPEPRIVIP